MKNKTVLVVGSGGREHAIVYKLLQSPQVAHVFIAPGNGGTAQIKNVSNVEIAATDITKLTEFTKTNNIDLTIVGPEVPLALGIVDEFNKHNLVILGPTQQAAQLESSKEFAKHIMEACNIPTAQYKTVTTLEDAQEYIEHSSFPLVIKADGLAAGKGVIIAQTKKEALQTVTLMLCNKKFGTAGTKVILEEFLEGTEVSFMALTDGTNYIPLTTAQDYKRRNNGDTGPNTGGMGAYSPAPIITQQLQTTIEQTIIKPVLKHMQTIGTSFVGFLYAGLMITKEGIPKVLEFNCRLGDPEAQPVLLRMQANFYELCWAATQKTLHTKTITWDQRKAVTIIIADGDYPYDKTSQPITVSQHKPENVYVFHSGTKLKDNELVTSGGRILGLTALEDTFTQARKNAYNYIKNIKFNNSHYRADIAKQL